MLLNLINLEAALIIWFIVFLMHFKFNAGYYIREMLKIKQTRSIKLLDCFPCLVFWTALIITLNPVVAIVAYFMAVVTDK